MPHRSIDAKSFLELVELATQYILSLLYRGKAMLSVPRSDRVSKQKARNAEIRARYAAGESYSQLAEAYGISQQRIGQIIHGRHH